VQVVINCIYSQSPRSMVAPVLQLQEIKFAFLRYLADLAWHH